MEKELDRKRNEMQKLKQKPAVKTDLIVYKYEHYTLSFIGSKNWFTYTYTRMYACVCVQASMSYVQTNVRKSLL